jgi:hypothetical protein
MDESELLGNAETSFEGVIYFFTLQAAPPTHPHPVRFGRPPRLTPEELGLPPDTETTDRDPPTA